MGRGVLLMSVQVGVTAMVGVDWKFCAAHARFEHPQQQNRGIATVQDAPGHVTMIVSIIIS